MDGEEARIHLLLFSGPRDKQPRDRVLCLGARCSPGSVRKRVDVRDLCGAGLGDPRCIWSAAGCRWAREAADRGRQPEPGSRFLRPGRFRRELGSPAGSCACALGGRSQVGAWDAPRAPWPHITGARPPPGGPGPRLLPGTRSQAGPPTPGAKRGAHGPPGTAISGAFPRGRPGLSQGFSRLPAACPPPGRRWRGEGRRLLPALGRKGGRCLVAQEGLRRRRSQGHAVVTEYGRLTRGALRMGFSRTFFFGGGMGDYTLLLRWSQEKKE